MAKGNPNHDNKGKFSSGNNSSKKSKIASFDVSGKSLPKNFDPKDPQAEAREFAMKLTMAKLKRNKKNNPSKY